MGRVLVADDNESIAHLVATIARMSGHEVEVVENGVLAIRALEERPFDVLILDVHMPVMSGLEVLRRIAGRTDMVIAVHSADDETRVEAMRLGANAFLRKSKPDELFAFVESHRRA